MTGTTHSAWRPMIALALCILAAGTAGGQQQAPAGTYRSPGASLRLKPDGNATVSGANGLVSIGSYHIAGDTIAVRDERGAASCGDAPGLYLWRIAADTLRLRALSDGCDVRRSALATQWTRMFTAGPSLAAVVITGGRLVCA